MRENRTSFLFLNLGHGYAHLFMLLYPTVVLALEGEFQGSYGALLALATGGFVAFGAGSLPAGWLGDRWSRHGMMAVFFLGLGLSSMVTGFARSPFEIAVGLTLIGVFASIYHPVGIALVVSGAERVGRRLGINGVWGNMGVASAALIAGALTDLMGWRAAFILPGAVAFLTGLAYMLLVPRPAGEAEAGSGSRAATSPVPRNARLRAFGVLAVSTVVGGLIFHAMTIGLPKVFDERMGDIADTTLGIGGLVSVIYAIAAFAQIAVGWLIDRYPLKPVFVIVVSLQVPLFVAAAWLSGPALLVGALAVMLLVFGEIPINDTLVARYTIDAWRSRVYAVKYALTLGVGTATVPMVAVTHELGGGFATLFATLSALALVIALAALLLPAESRVQAAPMPAGE
ncbi:MAG: MFS transporter [Kiloniellales bacterium]